MKFKIKELYLKIEDILEEREKNIIIMRFGLDGNNPKTQKEIGKLLNISRSYVSRLETKAIRKLSKFIEN